MKKIIPFSCPSLVLFLLLCLFSPLLNAQKPVKPSASDLLQGIKKLNVLGSVLYVAAHPDDENQRFISYCNNEKLYNVTYLSLTRGDGGQNLIGPELREQLGVLRTEELLMARSVDGGKQRFSRANDFGFSKTPDETLRIWDKNEVLSDVVWAIRQNQPDVIVNRFYHDKKYETHGHHTASAMLSVEAFDLAGKNDAYPDQLKYTQTWEPRRQFFNTSWWFYGGQEAFNKMDKSGLYSVDLGVYLPLKGKSNNEVAAEARSMHRCQGFGSLSTRGESVDWFDFIKGEKPKTNDLFEGINTTWTRVPNGAKIGKILAKVEQNFKADQPEASVPELLKAMQLIKTLPAEADFWKTIKLAEIKEVIRGCLGLYLESTAADAIAAPGDSVKIHFEAINRSGQAITLSSVSCNNGLMDKVLGQALDNNKLFSLDQKIRLPENAPLTGPYWLQKPYNMGMYTVEDQQLRGLPETPRYLAVRWSVTIDGIPLEYDTKVAYKTDEPAVGEVWRPFEVLPAAFVEFEQPSYLFNTERRDVGIKIKAGHEGLHGKVSLQATGDWVVTPSELPIAFKNKGEERTIYFTVTAPKTASETTLSAAITVDGQRYDLRMATIKYEHIPQQSVLLPARVHAARTDVQTKAKNIGYYMGAGDDIPNALRQMGCTVTMLEDKDFDAKTLRKFDAIVLGIRAYNTKEALAQHQQKLMEYTEGGGTLVVQYNNNFDLFVEKFAPFSMKLSRNRVTDENAEVRFLLPDHAVLNSPNKITPEDFNGWVQERGLYFPSEWDAKFAAPLSSNDPGEKPADGALLVAPYGKGFYVYTGLSFFRELPSGVPGAYRLFANMISLGK
jgi:LmbE family N-acetylglucosaminyl deacetylase